MNNPKKIIVHHTGGTSADPKASTQHHTVDTIDATHAARWPGFASQVFRNKAGKLYHVGYHYVIDAAGEVSRTRAHWEEGAHTIGMNNSSIGVCLTGNFDVGVDTPTAAQVEAFVTLFRKLKDDLPHLTYLDIEPHRRYATKTCFGSSLPDNHFSQLVAAHSSPAVLEDDGVQYQQQRTVLLTRLSELLQQYSALLIQVLSGKRLSLRE